MRIVHLISAFQSRGHETASIDPLELQQRPHVDELDYRTYGFSDSDLDRILDMTGIGSTTGLLSAGENKITLRALLEKLKRTYCGSVGVQYTHIRSREKMNWIRAKIEGPQPEFTPHERTQMLERLAYASIFESFLANKYNTTKRFGLEGCEGLIPGMKALVDTATLMGVDGIIMGMAHRGRLNVLANVIRKPLEQIFKEFQGTHVDVASYLETHNDWGVSGDVKYHLGTSCDRVYSDGRKVHLVLVPNPSHLEAVDPVVVGKARAKAYYNGDLANHKTMPVLIHGDAAFSGQGVVYETMQFSHLPAYSTGGCVHVVCNNQIGFTTDPVSSRSSQYSTDVGMAFQAPIFHVNGDDVEAVTRVFRLAAEYRQTFHDDVIIDFVGYRKHGHNELDQPLFTQPLMYKCIASKDSPLRVFQKHLVHSGHMSQQQVNDVEERVTRAFEEAFVRSKTYEPPVEKKEKHWAGMVNQSSHPVPEVSLTGVSTDQLRTILGSLTTLPAGFRVHPQLKKILEAKTKLMEQSGSVDWSTAEAMAFATLMQEGTHVRLSGQDVERGTFSHRHAVLHDQATDELFVPLHSVSGRSADAVICNSPLSEFGTLGYEFGYSLESPKALVLWEAQFGDFVNGAQVMIDQFISSAESKWNRQSGLVMLLPHGYDGQGAEHSSCRVERFLQASDEDPDQVPPIHESVRRQIQRANWQIVNCSTPANYFHALRRQCHRQFRKPLIVMSPKNLLRHKNCVSTVDEMGPGTKFERLLPDKSPKLVPAEAVRRVVLCSGKIYYELLDAREAGQISDVALVRLEQISPFPFDKVAEQMKKYSNAQLVWTQEEPKNMGAWYYVQDRIMTATRVLNGIEVRPAYVGRRTNASPAVGFGGVHNREQARIIATALSNDVDSFCHGIGVQRPVQ